MATKTGLDIPVASVTDRYKRLAKRPTGRPALATCGRAVVGSSAATGFGTDRRVPPGHSHHPQRRGGQDRRSRPVRHSWTRLPERNLRNTVRWGQARVVNGLLSQSKGVLESFPDIQTHMT